MSQSTTEIRTVPLATGQDVLTDLLRDGARRLPAQAIEAEVASWIDEHAHLVDDQGRRQVVRNGHLPGRAIQTGIGAVEVQQPRVRDRRPADQREAFTSAILPPYLRKTRSLEGLLPWLYLKGVSTGDFSEALQAILGPDAPGLSATTITRLKAAWEGEFAAWNKRSLAGKHYVYVWADGVHFNIRLEGGRQCILVPMGATAEGKKELIAIADGYRESEQSWKELLLDCKARGLEVGPHLAIGDGALGFWKAIRQIWDTTKEQRCWVHKTANVPDKMPKGGAAEGEGGVARDLRGRDEGRCGEGVRPVREDVPGQVSEGDGVPGEGQGSAAGVLRLPCRALGAHPDDEPDRERVLDGAAEARQDQGERESGGVPDDGVQADGECLEGLAIVERFASAGGSRQGDRLQGRHQGEGRRLKNPRTQLLTIPPAAAAAPPAASA